MAEKFLVPVSLPSWLCNSARRVKRAFIPPASPTSRVNIWGERHVEWTFLSSQMPCGPGEAIEFGCEDGFMSLVAAQRGFHVLANDLLEQTFVWQHPNVEFRKGDFLKLTFPRNHFDLAINCSSVEHVGVAGRYGTADPDTCTSGGEGDGTMTMTVPTSDGPQHVEAPFTFTYGALQNGLFAVTFRGGQWSGTAEVRPTRGDCVSSSVTRMVAEGRGTLTTIAP